MDEARLKEIEKLFEHGALGAYSPEHWDMAHELIAAIRYEWAKRAKYIEETFANLGESEKQTEQQQERAARAEAEVKRQQGTILSQAENIRLLYGVFLAAEELWAALAPAAIPILGPPGENLRRALDAAKDPAR